ncbi:transcriptional regulator [Streptomyces albus]|uniref:Transcriptional regulator n=1 Tax=Streptomyces albus (strain ATCC 21838 / DSM 41398 / FERM P-419 / JCM 4703 / NBRC 107858) TaxID=1081613 RepID=A0A0B5EH79_STRA4|nr:transcriptional regulator [Streptomyces albus]AOU75843.1 transcriptional regulator [Streptomyces albus]AYN31649.1 ROK family transcriptional regulator [Streptomyces albus]
MPTSQSSAGHLLELIRSGQATTRSELQTATGLSRSTVGMRLDQLFRAGWLRNTAGTSTGGRPSARLEFDVCHAAVLVVDLDTTHSRVAVTDLAGTILSERTEPLPVSEGPETVLETVASWMPGLLEATGTEAASVCGIGLSVPGPVDWETGMIIEPPIMPGWSRYPVRATLQEAFTRHMHVRSAPPVLLDNDANLMAYGEQRHHYPHCPALVLVKVSAGIGAGVILSGTPYRGIDGGVGDMGHIRLHDRDDALCTCGSYGCLAAVASGRAIAQELSRAGVPTASAAEAAAHLATGQPDAVRLTREAGQRTGEVLVTVVTFLNPAVLVIAGDMASTPFLTGVRELLYRRAMPRTTAHLTVTTSQLGDRAALMGAAAMVVEHLYSPEIADARLASAGP